MDDLEKDLERIADLAKVYADAEEDKMKVEEQIQAKIIELENGGVQGDFIQKITPELKAKHQAWVAALKWVLK